MGSYEQVASQTPDWQTTVYVGNLTPYTSVNDLVPLFGNYGYVVETRFQSDRGFAFIKMETHSNAAMAICQLNGYNVNGRPLKCSWGKERPPQQQGQSGGGYESYPPSAVPNSAYPPATPGGYGYPQYGGPASQMSPQVPHSAQTGYSQTPGGYGSPGMAQPYQQQGGYGRGQNSAPPQQPQQQWNQQQPQGGYQGGYGYQG